MNSTASTEKEKAADDQELSDSSQGRSTIKFPYQDLDDAVEVAKAIHNVGGTTCQKDQLAAELKMAATGGGFAMRLITAKVFGLITSDKGTVSLTSLGSRICDSQQEKSARAEAFLNVPLYNKVYEQFKGTVLPPSTGLEGAMEAMGVAPKQKDKARQVFQRSATQAGFFAYGANRLVMPSVRGASEVKDPDAGNTTNDPKKPPSGGDDGGNQRHPLIDGLIRALPADGNNWPLDSRKKWLQAAAMNFDFVYTDSPEETGSLKVTIERETSAK